MAATTESSRSLTSRLASWLLAAAVLSAAASAQAPPVVAASPPAPAPAAAPGAPNQPSLSAAEVAARHYQARGGAAVASTRTLRMTGMLVLEAGFEHAEGTVVMELVPAANQARIELTLGSGTVVNGFDGTRGWHQAGGQVAEVSGEDLSSIRRTAAFAGVLTPQEGRRIEVLGPGAIRGQPTLVVRSTDADGSSYLCHLATDTWLEVMEQRRAADGRLIAQSWLGDFRTVGVLTIPHEVWTSALTRTPGSPAATWNRVSWQKVEVDVDLPASRFAMPSAAP